MGTPAPDLQRYIRERDLRLVVADTHVAASVNCEDVEQAVRLVDHLRVFFEVEAASSQ